MYVCRLTEAVQSFKQRSRQAAIDGTLSPIKSRAQHAEAEVETLRKALEAATASGASPTVVICFLFYLNPRFFCFKILLALLNTSASSRNRVWAWQCACMCYHTCLSAHMHACTPFTSTVPFDVLILIHVDGLVATSHASMVVNTIIN